MILTNARLQMSISPLLLNKHQPVIDGGAFERAAYGNGTVQMCKNGARSLKSFHIRKFIHASDWRNAVCDLHSKPKSEQA